MHLVVEVHNYGTTIATNSNNRGGTMIGENQQLVTDEPVESEK